MKSSIKRKVKWIAIAVTAFLTLFVIWTIYSTIEQKKADARVVADIHELMEQRLTSLKADDPIIRHYGPFQRWEKGDWSRPHHLGMLVSRLETRGIAHFQRADVKADIVITKGPKAIQLRNGPNDEQNSKAWSQLWEMMAATHPDFDL